MSSTAFRPRSKRARDPYVTGWIPRGAIVDRVYHQARRQVEAQSPMGHRGRRMSTIHFLTSGKTLDTPFDALPLAQELLVKQPGQVAEVEVYGPKGNETHLALIRAGAISHIEVYVG